LSCSLRVAAGHSMSSRRALSRLFGVIGVTGGGCRSVSIAGQRYQRGRPPSQKAMLKPSRHLLQQQGPDTREPDTPSLHHEPDLQPCTVRSHGHPSAGSHGALMSYHKASQQMKRHSAACLGGFTSARKPIPPQKRPPSQLQQGPHHPCPSPHPASRIKSSAPVGRPCRPIQARA
jgi:hypothetical protein